MNRRTLLRATALAPIAGLLAACQTGSTPGAPPTLAQVQAWVNSVTIELPAIETTLVADGTLTGQAVVDFDKAVAAAQAELPLLNALTPGAVTTQQVVTTIGNALMVAAGFIPAASPYTALIGIAVILVNGFLNQTPVTQNGAPIADKPPAQAAVHAAAMAPVQTNN